MAAGISFGIDINASGAMSALNQMRSALGIFEQQARAAMSSVRQGAGDAFGQARDRAQQAQDTMSRAMVFQGMQQAGNQIAGVGRSITQGVVGALQGATSEAMALETAMAEVSKLTGLEGAPLTALRGELVKLSSTAIPSTAVELAEIAAAGGSLGVATGDLNKFVQTIAQMSVAFDMGTGETGQKIGEIANGFKMLNPETGKLDFERVQTFGNVVNYLADTMATSEAKIINSMQRMSGNAMYGFSENDLSAIAASMTSLGIAPEVAATSLNTTIARLASATTQSEKAQTAMEGLGFSAQELQAGMVGGKGMETFQAFITKVASMGSSAGPLLSQALGLEASDEIARLAGSLPLFEKAMASAQNSIAGKGSTVADSMKIMAGTSAAQMKMMQNAVVGLQMKVGDVFNKLTAPMINATTLFVNFASTMLEKYPVMAKVVVGVGLVVAAFGVLLTVGGGLIAAIGAIGSAWLGFPAALAMVSGAIPVVTGALAGIATPLLAVLPIIGIFAAAIAGVGFIIYRFWGPIKTFFGGVMSGIRDGFLVAQEPMAEFRAALSVAGEAFRPAFNFLTNAFRVLFLEQMPSGGSAARSFGQIVGSIFGVMISGIAMAISGWAKLFAFFTQITQHIGIGIAQIVQGTHPLGNYLAGGISAVWQTSVARWNAAGATLTLWGQSFNLVLTNFRVTSIARMQAAHAQVSLWGQSFNLFWTNFRVTSIARMQAASATFSLWTQSIRLAFAQFSSATQVHWGAAQSTFLLWMQSINLAFVQFKSDAIGAWQAAANIFTSIWTAITGAFQTFGNAAKSKIDAFAQLVQGVLDAINNVIQQIRSRLASFVPNFSVPAPVAAVASTVTSAAAPAANAAQSAVSTATNAASTAANAVGAAISGAINTIIGGQPPVTNKIPGTAAQGFIPANMSGLMAAARQESAQMPAGAQLMVANSSEAILRPNQLQALVSQAGRGTNINNSFTINISGAGANAEALADQIVRILDAKLNEELAAIL